ncbi:MAG: GNAT family N-acetyltransferase [Peptoniphilus sp.]|nr:GNAT family N-acetyltransferase [Peptoniphilus sp.]
MINIVYEENNDRAAAYDGKKLIGQCTYSKSDNIWIIDHTLVDPEYGGQGIAAKLVKEVVDNAREKGVKIVPLCSYAVKQFEKKEEYRDLLKK